MCEGTEKIARQLVVGWLRKTVNWSTSNQTYVLNAHRLIPNQKLIQLRPVKGGSLLYCLLKLLIMNIILIKKKLKINTTFRTNYVFTSNENLTEVLILSF